MTMEVPLGKGTRKRVRACSGKFDQLGRNAPKIWSKLVNQKWFFEQTIPSPLSQKAKKQAFILFSYSFARHLRGKTKKQKEKEGQKEKGDGS